MRITVPLYTYKIVNHPTPISFESMFAKFISNL